ncbi:unnamed protein product [Polarella glacialis]|uniref:Uncharacterized protein n=1 Tax=Polarella glacialis TaxID=89957 RepID=A0A813I5V9_POLGL|nr:unnamed protein product [Polarella glacialis]
MQVVLHAAVVCLEPNMCVDINGWSLLCYAMLHGDCMVQTVRDMSNDMTALYCMSFQLEQQQTNIANKKTKQQQHSHNNDNDNNNNDNNNNDNSSSSRSNSNQ